MGKVADAILVTTILTVGAFMAGNAWGLRTARKDYEPIIASLQAMIRGMVGLPKARKGDK